MPKALITATAVLALATISSAAIAQTAPPNDAQAASPVEEGAAAFQAGDYAKAVMLWQAAAGQGDALAAYNMGMVYETGRGVSKNDREALRWYQKAADLGVPIAEFKLGVHYEKSDMELARQWLRKANDSGIVKAAIELGASYCKEKSEDSHHIGMDWYRKAADQGYVVGASLAGLNYYLGVCAPKNLDEAAHWLQRAIDLGDTSSTVLLDAVNAERTKR